MAARSYEVTVGSAVVGGKSRTIRGTLPLTGREAYEFGTGYPSAQQLAQHYAAEFCDSGSVAVRIGRDRGLVARRLIG